MPSCLVHLRRFLVEVAKRTWTIVPRCKVVRLARPSVAPREDVPALGNVRLQLFVMWAKLFVLTGLAKTRFKLALPSPAVQRAPFYVLTRPASKHVRKIFAQQHRPSSVSMLPVQATSNCVRVLFRSQ